MSICRLFARTRQLLSRWASIVSYPTNQISPSNSDADSQYRIWICDRVSDASNLLLSLLEDSKSLSVREAALVAYVKIIVADGRRRDKKSTTTTTDKKSTTKSKSKHLVNERAFNALVKTLLSSGCDMSELLPRWVLVFADSFYTYIVVIRLLGITLSRLPQIMSILMHI